MEILILGILFAFGFSVWFIATSDRNAEKKVLAAWASRGIELGERVYFVDGFFSISLKNELFLAYIKQTVYEVPFAEILSFEVINTFLNEGSRHEISLRMVIKDINNPNLKITFLPPDTPSIYDEAVAETHCNQLADKLRIIIETEKEKNRKK